MGFQQLISVQKEQAIEQVNKRSSKTTMLFFVQLIPIGWLYASIQSKNQLNGVHRVNKMEQRLDRIVC